MEINFAISLVVGLLIGLLGYRLKEKFFSLIMTIICAYLAYSIANTYFDLNTWMLIVVALVGGLIGGLFSRRIEKGLIVLVSGLLMLSTTTTMFGTSWLTITVGLLIGLLLSLLVLKLERIGIILVTSIYGASILLVPLRSLNVAFGSMTDSLMLAIISIFFIVIQLATTKN